MSTQYQYFQSLSNLSREFKEKICMEFGWSYMTFDKNLKSSKEIKKYERETIHKVAYSLLTGIVNQNLHVLETEFKIDISALEAKAQTLNSEIQNIKTHVNLFNQNFTNGTPENKKP